MKSAKILAILVVGVMSVSLLATVEKPGKVGKPFEAVWDALVDLQGQIVQEIADRIFGDESLQAAIDAEEAARIAANAALQNLLEAAIASGDTATADAAQAANDALQAQIDAIPVLPGGVIVMWSGSIGDIPDGWALCDGGNGTPDLTDKFICGSDGEDLGATGGSATHGHDYSDLPHHSHGVTDPGHTHDVPSDGTHKVIVNVGSYQTVTRLYPNCTTASATTGITINDSGKASCSTDAANGLPPYYKLAFIMKL